MRIPQISGLKYPELERGESVMEAPQRKGGTGTARPEQGGPTLSPQERELKAFLEGLKVEYEVEETDELEGSADEMFTDAVDAVIKTWASYWDVEINEDAELCEPDSNAYATGMGFRHSTHFTCFAVLEDGRHVHVGWKSGYVGNKNYYHVEEVRLEVAAQ